jgi:hypothetical protein
MEIANPSTKTLGFVCFHGAKKINIDPTYAQQSMDLTTMLLKPKHRSSVFTKDGPYHHAEEAWISKRFQIVGE